MCPQRGGPDGRRTATARLASINLIGAADLDRPNDFRQIWKQRQDVIRHRGQSPVETESHPVGQGRTQNPVQRNGLRVGAGVVEPHAEGQAGLPAGSSSSPCALIALSAWPFLVRIEMRRHEARSRPACIPDLSPHAS